MDDLVFIGGCSFVREVYIFACVVLLEDFHIYHNLHFKDVQIFARRSFG